MDRLYSAAKRAIVQSLKVKKGEKLLLVTDRQKMKIAEAIAHWANKSNAEVTTYLMTETVRPITAPTAIFKEMMAMADLTMYMLDARVAEKPFRGYMVANGARRTASAPISPSASRVGSGRTTTAISARGANTGTCPPASATPAPSRKPSRAASSSASSMTRSAGGR
jgi:hypothetical protein